MKNDNAKKMPATTKKSASPAAKKTAPKAAAKKTATRPALEVVEKPAPDKDFYQPEASSAKPASRDPSAGATAKQIARVTGTVLGYVASSAAQAVKAGVKAAQQARAARAARKQESRGEESNVVSLRKGGLDSNIPGGQTSRTIPPHELHDNVTERTRGARKFRTGMQGARHK